MKNVLKYFCFSFVLVTGSFVFCSTVKAFSIFPVRQTVVIDPGKVAVASVQIYNDENETIQVVPEIDAFQLDPDTGHAQFGHADVAKSWIQSNVSTITLRPKEKRVVDFTISVPSGASRESHYLSLFLKEKSAGGQIGIGKRIGTLLFLHVSGDVSEKMQVQDFSIEKQNGKVFAHIQTHNLGNIHVVPNGSIDLFNTWGKKFASVPVNTEQRMVLPSGEWRTIVELPNVGLKNTGRIRAELHLQYGVTNQAIQQTMHFWYAQGWSILGVSLLILGGVLSILFWKRNKRL